jgi:molybdenum ABC transporter molybdate-binding protein
VFAAASLTDALQHLGAEYKAVNKDTIRFSFAASSTLARQIEAGAPADIFISANEEWMDYLAAENDAREPCRQYASHDRTRTAHLRLSRSTAA